MKLLSMLSEVIFQVIIFSLLPFLWWFFTARRKESFFSWIGLKAVKGSWPKVIGGILFFFLLCLVSQLWWIPHLLRRNGVERISLRFSFRNHPDRALRGNSLPRLPRQKAYQPLRLCHGQSAAGTGIRPPARSHVFSGDRTAESAHNYADYWLQRLASRMDGRKSSRRLHPSRMDGSRSRESAALYGRGIRITVTDRAAK